LLQQQAQKAGGRIVAILGEEEARLLASPKEYQNKSLENEMKEKHLSLSDVVATGVASGVVTRGMFLRSMPVAAKIGRWLFAHSGYYPNVILPQFQYLTSAFMSRGVYTHPFILGRDSIVTAQWILDGKKKSLLYQRLIYNSILGIVFGNQYNSFGAPNEIGVLEGRFVRVNVGMGYDEGRSAGRLLVFIKPKQMEYNRIPELYSMAPNGSLSPLN
jgi:hypothetical protein